LVYRYVMYVSCGKPLFCSFFSSLSIFCLSSHMCPLWSCYLLLLYLSAHFRELLLSFSHLRLDSWRYPFCPQKMLVMAQSHLLHSLNTRVNLHLMSSVHSCSESAQSNRFGE